MGTGRPRFDTRNAGYENEANRFGWIVEVDPFDPTSTPKKHSSLGRFKHEGANVIVADPAMSSPTSATTSASTTSTSSSRKDKYREGDRTHNMTLLSAGNLYVAKFTGNSPAAEIDGYRRGPGRRFVRRHRRVAAAGGGRRVHGRGDDGRGGPGLHPPRRGQGGPHQDGPLRGRGAEPAHRQGLRGLHQQHRPRQGGQRRRHEANPRNENRDGHIVEITETGDQTSTTFTWNLLMVCGDPAQGDVTYFSGFPMDKVSPISCPDNLAFDSVGNLWISTDGAPAGIGYADGLFKVTLEGAERGKVEQFLAVPREAETCGPVIHDDERIVFVAVQHPGEDGTFEAQDSFFPDYVHAGATPEARPGARARARGGPGLPRLVCAPPDCFPPPAFQDALHLMRVFR